MAEVEKAFSDYAKRYDEDFTSSPIGILQRKRVREYFSVKRFYKGAALLEIGCGTGEDVKWFLQHGFDVTATDISPGMVDVAKKKNPATKILQGDAKNIVTQFAGKKFDVIFSDFGVLNCLSQEELENWATNIHELLNHRGKLIFVVMGRNCKWEQRYFLRKGENETAFRRKNADGVRTIISGSEFKTYYYSPDEFFTFFKEHFELKGIRPVGYYLPPSYLNDYFKKHPLRLKFLSLLENTLSFARDPDKADHYYIEMELK
ncbi:MAG TPA: class I SAM-dependent methyltransferase [Bacteroidia bacterium]|jgi:SAM-dependent methyltransferase|nr:class I SAM-dependent methyltransferase [Bacteroidia bacterium]